MGRDAGTDTIAAVVREATSADARGIAEVHVRCWQAAYGGILPRQLLDDLSVDLRSDFWGAELSDENSRARTLVAEDRRHVCGPIAVECGRRQVAAARGAGGAR